jgi:glycosyltransferase involved in cell wall biosynthesis
LTLADVTFCIYDKPGIVGGTSAWIRWLIPELMRRGIDANCFCFLHTGEKGPTVTHLEKAGVRCSIYRGAHFTEDRVRWIRTEIDQHPTGIFVPNEVPAAYHAIPWLKRKRTRTVGVMHSHSPAAHAMKDIFAGRDRERSLDALVCVSKEIEASVMKSPPPFTHVHRIPCGASIPAKTTQFQADRFRIAYSGRFADEAKRIRDVARAFCEVTANVHATEAILIGDGPQRREVEEILAEHGRGLPVTVTGYVGPERVQEHLLTCQAIVLMSKYEGLPVSLMEGMACGCVPVCRDIESGIPELVKNGVTGLIIGDNREDFIAAIQSLVTNSQQWRELSTRARSLIESEYSHSICASKWEGLIRDLLQTPARNGSILSRPALLSPRPPFDSQGDRRPKAPIAQRFRNQLRKWLSNALRHPRIQQ